MPATLVLPSLQPKTINDMDNVIFANSTMYASAVTLYDHSVYGNGVLYMLTLQYTFNSKYKIYPLSNSADYITLGIGQYGFRVLNLFPFPIPLTEDWMIIKVAGNNGAVNRTIYTMDA